MSKMGKKGKGEKGTSNKVRNSCSSTLELIFLTNNVREGCSPTGCSTYWFPGGDKFETGDEDGSLGELEGD